MRKDFLLLINIFSVAQVDYVDQEDDVHDLIDDTVVANAHTVTVRSLELFITVRPGITAQFFKWLKIGSATATALASKRGF